MIPKLLNNIIVVTATISGSASGSQYSTTDSNTLIAQRRKQLNESL